jgi:N-acylneuraminate cytidylyltransferase
MPMKRFLKKLAIIPARGGSKGLPHKNVRLLAGKPLIAHTIEQALGAQSVTRIIVSTDDDEIASVSKEYGAEVIKRPVELATDAARSESALKQVLDHLREMEGYEPHLVAFLQCTSPVRTSRDIDRAVQVLLDENADSLVSVTPWHGLNWTLENGEAKSVTFDYHNRPRRQDMRPEFRENGSIFIFRPSVLNQLDNRLGGRIVLFKMSPWTRFEADTLEDFALCEWIVQNKIYA